MMTIDDKRGEGGKNAEKLMTSYVNDPLVACAHTIVPMACMITDG
jgi:hypothetical protein